MGSFSGLDPAQHRAPVVRDRRLGYGAHRSAGHTYLVFGGAIYLVLFV